MKRSARTLTAALTFLASLAAALPARADDPPVRTDEAEDAAARRAAPRPVIEPWSDADPKEEGKRYSLGDFGFRAGAEYRAQLTYINPISLNTENAREVSFIEHRLRADLGVDYKDKVRLVFSSDVLDGVLWGDNGTYGGDPSSNAGTNVNVKNPNISRPCVALRGGDPLDSQSYGYTICSADYFKVRKLYGEVVLPFGLLRVGRQPVNIGTGVQAADGDGRPNRFGISRTGNVVDRILFATKPLEAFKPKHLRSTSPNDGLILALAYDRWVTDDPQNLGAAVNQWDTALRFATPDWPGGHDLLLAAYHAYRWDGQFGSKINSFGVRAISGFGPVTFGVDVAANVGTTREIASSYHVITNDPVVDQPVRQLGARAVLRYDHKYFSVYLEGDYASGDEDPQARTPLTQFSFAEDANIGLLMFKHILAFQTARASAAGVEVLRRLNAPSLPAEAVATRGAFTNGIAIFPQLDVRPLPGLLLRGGVLVAWAASKVVDPIASLQRRDGLSIADDLVNFAGGKPGSFYGTELDGRIQYRFLDHFLLDLEGAVLFPGDAFKNQDGYAVRSGLLNVRTTFYF
ncbi:MAG: hypothetical protein QM820_00355 [Minicystis sp.]